jgi:uncharacterized membrane protein required for colicin V production
MNKLLLVVGAIFLISIIVGYVRGFLKIAVSLAITVASIFLVMAISPHISAWLQESTAIEETVKNKLEEMIEMPEGMSPETLASVEIPREQQIALIEGAGLPGMIQDMLLENNNSEAYQALGVTNFVDYIGSYITKLIADIIAFLVAWMIVTIIARILMGVIGIIGKIPVIGGVNKLAGAVVGAGIALIIVWILFILVTLLYNTTVGQACMTDIAASQILTKLYDGNVLMKYITKF